MAVCLSCGRNTHAFVTFPCASASCPEEHKRCRDCRENDVKYACKQCGFEGP